MQQLSPKITAQTFSLPSSINFFNSGALSVKENVLLVTAELESAPELKKLIDEGKLKVASGVYHLKNGKVEFFSN